MPPSATDSASSHNAGQREDGLAEWTSKIRAMQKRLDADEEAEQRRLEEEITASRLARQRRSKGISYPGRANSVDLKDLSRILPPSVKESDDVSDAETGKTPLERKRGQDDALSKLMGRDSKPPEIPYKAYESPPPSKGKTPQPEPISLAAFMGGNASGPRLNKHRQQQDAQDATQFVQYNQITSPHPVFGTGGVAMPGMTKRKTDPTPSSSKPLVEKPTSGVRSNVSPTSVSLNEPSSRSTTRDTTPWQQPSPSPTEYKTRSKMQDPTTDVHNSLLASASLNEQPSLLDTKNLIPSFRQQQHSPSPTERNTGHSLPATIRATPMPQPLTPPGSKPHSAKRYSTPPPKTTSPPASVSPKSPVQTPSLARPLAPQPRKSLTAEIPPSSSPSPAFLKPPAQKAPTPSLSRLKGRGFVQSMVQQSVELEHSSRVPSAMKLTPVKGSITGRWPHSPPSKDSPSQTPPSPIPVRKTHSMETAPRSPVPLAGIPIQKSISSQPSLAAEKPSSKPVTQSNGLGSATTLHVFTPEPLSSMRNTTRDLDTTQSKRAPASRPLMHPTKERARKPKKANKLHEKTEGATQPENIPDVSSVTLNGTRTETKPNWNVASSSRHTPETDPTTGSTTSKPFEGKELPGLAMTQKKNEAAHRQQSTGDSETIVSIPPVALPGLVQDQSSKPASESKPLPRHTRIPSTGNRPTVMVVAQALQDKTLVEPLSPEPTESSHAFATDRPVSLRPQVVNASEKRKSSYEKYASIMLPSVTEESSPATTPASSLRERKIPPPDVDFLEVKLVSSPRHTTEPRKLPDTASNKVLSVPAKPLPVYDITILTKPKKSNTSPASEDLTISVEVLQITSDKSSPLQQSSVFYDTEAIAIIHRWKSRESGLASTTVWSWQGKCCNPTEKQQSRIRDLASRYGTSSIPVIQGAESSKFVKVLGGRLVIRQGARSHWTADNTTMHVVRELGGVIIIDELDLDIVNLCSGFSYIVTALGNIYVWYGRGTVKTEREAALRYAESLGQNANIVEIVEGEDDDEMFWMILGQDEFASADYWRWRPMTVSRDPRVWEIGHDLFSEPFHEIETFFGKDVRESIYIVDCYWEIYVLVGHSRRHDIFPIRFALSAARDLSSTTTATRPYKPPVHIIILPSELPVELRAHFRYIDSILNDKEVPTGFNVVSSVEAIELYNQAS